MQSGSDRILAMMKRNHTANEYKEKIRKLREVRPDISVTTDIIVGFPTETDEDFEATLELAKELQFDQAFSFIYSPRPGTPAALLKDNIPVDIKKERLKRLQDMLNQQASLQGQKLIGSIQQVLVEGPSTKDPNKLFGHTDNNRSVKVEGEACLGELIKVRITEASVNMLGGIRVA